MVQSLAQHVALMGLNNKHREGLDKLLELLLESPAGQAGELLRVIRAVGQLVQHFAPAHAEYIGGHRAELDVRALEDLLDLRLT